MRASKRRGAPPFGARAGVQDRLELEVELPRALPSALAGCGEPRGKRVDLHFHQTESKVDLGHLGRQSPNVVELARVKAMLDEDVEVRVDEARDGRRYSFEVARAERRRWSVERGQHEDMRGDERAAR